MSPDDLSPEQLRAFEAAFLAYRDATAVAQESVSRDDVVARDNVKAAGRAWRACMEIYFQIPVPVRIRVPNGRPDLRVVK